MSDYNVQKESQRILLGHIINDERLGWSPEVKKACQAVKFVGDGKPFIPTPLKITESVSALSALVGGAAAAVAEERYGIKQDVTVNTDKATLFLLGILLPTVDGKSIVQSKSFLAAASESDKFKMAKPIHMQASNIYQCKDGKWYHTHQSFNAGPTMKMLGVQESDVTTGEAQKIYIEKVKQWDSATLDTTANDQYMQAGCICNTVEEFFAHPHTKVIEKEPVASITALKAPKKPWPKVTSTDYRPLAGIRVVDLTRAVAGPTVTKLLAVLGADVIKIGSTTIPDVYMCLPDINTGKRDVDINLKTPEGKAAFMKIVKDADVLVDGYRPHALAKLGRENCYGHIGPLAYRSGWQQIADCFAGLSWMQGEFLGLNEPVIPLLPNADYQTGVLGAAFIIQALQKRANADVTFDIDISLLQYNIWYQRLGAYNPEQNKLLLARNPSFKARHYDEMGSMFRKMVDAIKESRPGLLENPEFYSKMSGKEWNIDGDLSILAPPFDFTRSEISYLCPSGRRGWSNNNPEWIPVN